MNSLEIVAHRGASQHAPENTLAAFELAWRHGADAIELDVHQCQSGEIVVIHDSNALRTTGFDGEIADMSLDEIQSLDAGRWKGARFAGERIPTLDEVLERVPPGKRVFIEIKALEDVEATNKIFAPLQKTLERAALCDQQIAIIGFKLELMKTAKRLFPKLQVNWIRGPWALKLAQGRDLSQVIEELIEDCHHPKIDGLNLWRVFLTSEADFARVRAAGLQLYVSVENEPHLLRYVNGFMTDDPAQTRARLGRLGGGAAPKARQSGES